MGGMEDPRDPNGIMKYEAVGSVIDAVSRFNEGVKTGKIHQYDDIHGKELEALRRALKLKGHAGDSFAAVVAAYKLGYMRLYDRQKQGKK